MSWLAASITETTFGQTRPSFSEVKTACIIYTSGTGGAPKGVMLHHGAILSNLKGAWEVLAELGLGDEVFLSFLPLSHAYEHTVGQFLPIALGAEIYYAESADRVAANLREARPTIVMAVPRFYEIMQQRIMHGVRKQGGMREKLFLAALSLGRRRYLHPQSFGVGARIVDFFLDKLVREKVRESFGGRLKAMVSGGAPLNTDVAVFFRAVGLPLFQGYGQTEAAPLISVNHPRRLKLHTVGPPIKGAEVRIADDGEILVRGELVMQGYWLNEEATRQAINDGWLHTGDIGEIDADGDLRYHRPQEGPDRQLRRRQPFPGAHRGPIDPSPRDRSGDDLRRPAATLGCTARPEYGVDEGLGASSRQAGGDGRARQ